MVSSNGIRQSRTRRPWWISFVIAVAVVIVVLVVNGLFCRTEPPRPFVVNQTADLGVPGTAELPSRSFPVEEGQAYSVSFDVLIQKPVDSPGEAVFVSVLLQCTGPDGTKDAIGGTQNVVTGQPATLRNQVLVKASASGDEECRVTVQTPNESAAARGATTNVDVTWQARAVDVDSVSVPSDEHLPRVVLSGKQSVAFRSKSPVGVGESIQAIGTLHVTTCTMVNGSREGGKPLCTRPTIDKKGSEFEVKLRVDVRDASGRVCESRDLSGTLARVDRTTHHALVPVGDVKSFDDGACGDEAEYVLSVRNHGPAALVVHGESSSLLLLTE